MMVYCVHCQSTLKVPEAAVSAPRARIGCARCSGSFLLSEARPAPPPAPPAPVRVAAPAAAAAAPVAAPPLTAPVPRPTVSIAAAAPAVTRAAAATAPALAPAVSASPRPAAPGSWRRCAQHRQARSEHVCPACHLGHCRQCVQMVQSAAICPTCEGLCVPAADFEEKERRAQQRARPLFGELGTILGYPFTDTLAFVLMAVVVGLVNLVKPYAFGPIGLFSQGILMAYSFNALRKVANGDLKGFMPSIGDVADLAIPMRQGTFAFLGSTWPLMALMILAPFALAGVEGVIADVGEPSAVHAQAEAEEEATAVDPEDEGDEAASTEAPAWTEPPAPQRTLLILLVLAFAVFWKVVYSPVALIVAVMTQSAGGFSSLLQTLNPLVGIGAIMRMGSVYWQALGIYCMIALPQMLIGGLLGLVPFGGFFRAFVDGYAMLCIGCALGLAVFKKAPELGLD